MPTVLILGATSDIGLAIARKFAAEKYDVQLAGRQLEQLQSIQTDFSVRYGVNCTIHCFDTLLIASHAQFYHELTVKPDISIYVIGYMADNDKVFCTWEEALLTINTNYTGAVSILNLIGAEYALRKTGVIVGISSVAGNRGRQSNFIYGSSKAALTAYLSGLRNKLYHSGVHVMTVLPGFVDTRMTEHLQLPKVLTAQPHQVATAIYNGILNKRDIVYVKWFWRYIMFVIGLIPETIFKKKRL